MSNQCNRILAIDGGGIRGVIALEYLERIEAILCPIGTGRRLGDVFDHIAGTSTGAIIAAGLALGMSVADLKAFYREAGAEMFDPARLWHRLHYRFDDDNLAKKLKQVIGEDTTLGSDRLRCLLTIVMRNATTDSPWTLTNNPAAKYNDPDHSGCNAHMPLWQLVRASTAAPTYFPPESITVRSGDGQERQFLFVDGGVTVYNNPAFLAYVMSTVRAFWPRAERMSGKAGPFATGKDRLLLVSVGTGKAPLAKMDLSSREMWLGHHATTVPSALMNAASDEQDTLCRMFGDCRYGEIIDRQLGALTGAMGEGAVPEKLFTYMRYNVELSREALDGLGLKDVDHKPVQDMANVPAMTDMARVGKAAADRQVMPEHFDGFVD